MRFTVLSFTAWQVPLFSDHSLMPRQRFSKSKLLPKLCFLTCLRFLQRCLCQGAKSLHLHHHSQRWLLFR